MAEDIKTLLAHDPMAIVKDAIGTLAVMVILFGALHLPMFG